MVDTTKSERNIIIALVIVGLVGSGVVAYRQHINKSTLTIRDFSAPQSSLAAIEGEIHESKVVNINRASVEELQALDGIGPKLAQEIILYRQANGPFRAPEDITKVKGLGPKKFEAIKEYIRLE